MVHDRCWLKNLDANLYLRLAENHFILFVESSALRQHIIIGTA